MGNEAFLGRLCSQLSLEDKVRLLTGRDSWSTHPLPQIGLRSMVLSDGPAGVRGSTWDERSPSVNFPSPTAVAASWDPRVVKSVGEGLGSEARRKNVDVVLAPTINLQRTPYGGRHFEAFSEDPVLTGTLATAYVRGIQMHGVGATVKHYVANDSETERFTVDVRVDERVLREVYLAAFEAPVVDGGAWLVMSAYNSINGATASENELLETPLNDEWGFDGVVVSDWTGVRSLESARYPQDLVMPGPDGPWGDALVDAVRQGIIDEDVIDRKVIRILRLAERVGALKGGALTYRRPQLSGESLRGIARHAATAGTVLLTNSGLLPLVSATASIAMIGEGARSARTQGGGSATVIPERVVTPLAGIQSRWPDAEVRWARGAIVDEGIADLPLDTFRAPDGTPGMLVTYLDDTGKAIASEHRSTSRIVSFDADSLVVSSDCVVFELTWTPESGPGVAALGISGVCDFEVIADGELVTTGALRLAPEDDHATAILNPPYTVITVPVKEEQVHLEVRLRPAEGGIPDALTLRLGAPPPAVDPDELITEAAEVAASADVAVVIVSTSAEVESEGFDRTSLRLPGRQDELVRAVAAANPRTIVVVNSGAPVLLPWIEDVAAALVTWFPGQEFGASLADVLSGDREPGGRLPMTWPRAEEDVPVSDVTPSDGVLRYSEGVHIGYRAWLREGSTPAFAFGHGLGYTEWSVDDDVEPVAVVAGEGVELSFTVTNTGDRQGSTVMQVYLERDDDSSIDRPVRWLAAFHKVTAMPATPTQITVTLDDRALASWDAGWSVEPGRYRVLIGTSAVAIHASATVDLLSDDVRTEAPTLAV